MTTLIPRFGSRVIREIKSGKRDSNGKVKVTAEELRTKRTAMNAKINEAIYGAPKKAKDNERKKAKDAADKWFSEWIRLRDAGPNGRVKCITCSHTDHWRYQQCGHS